jgi:hypothetical protein
MVAQYATSRDLTGPPGNDSVSGVALVAFWSHGTFGNGSKMVEMLGFLCDHLSPKKPLKSGLFDVYAIDFKWCPAAGYYFAENSACYLSGGTRPISPFLLRFRNECPTHVGPVMIAIVDVLRRAHQARGTRSRNHRQDFRSG